MGHFLAFSYNVHDSSVSVADERRVRLVLEAERYFGVKKKACSHAEMEELVEVALRACGLTIADVEEVACTAYQNQHLPDAQRNVQWTARAEIGLQGRRFKALVLNHHLAHAAIVHGFPNAREVAIDVCDGGGDFDDTHRIYLYRDGALEQLPNRPVHDSFSSRFYDIVSRYIYKGLMCEGKLMALASLGEPRDEIVSFLRDHLRAFHSAPPARSLALLASRFPFEDSRASRIAVDLAASTQHVFERLRLQSVLELPPDTPQVLLAGGATLNILANTHVRAHYGGAREVLIPPCCDDTGQSLGAILYLTHEALGLSTVADMPFLGYSDSPDDSALDERHVSDQLIDHLAGGGITFLHRGQSEIGPRALGHRSIVAVPSPKNHDLINHVIKQREFYRPLAPIVTSEAVSDWFHWEGESRYMLFAATAQERALVQAPGVCHYDGSARIQTVDERDPFLHRVLARVGEATGCPILINTSLNPKGVPICSRLEETMAFQARFRDLGVAVFSGGQLQR